MGFLITDFKEQAERVALSAGMPNVRTQFIRGPVWGRTPEQIRKQIVDGANPLTGKPMMQEAVEKLTAPLTAVEMDLNERVRDIGPPTYTGTEENLHKLFLEKRYTDFLPIVLPTKERVDEMLAQTSHDPDMNLGRMSALGQIFTYTVRHAAIAAVMAGCKPEYFPVVLAIGSTGTAAVSVSDNGFMVGAVINGPIRDEIGLNYDVGAVGPFAHANTTIGRAWSLLAINGGDQGKVGSTYMGQVGNPANLINIIIAENEELSPWEPLSIRRGFNKGESVVTIFNGWGILSARNWAITDWSSTPNYAKNIRDIHLMQDQGQFGTFAVLTPPVANLIRDAGYDTVEKLTEFVMSPDQGSGTPKPRARGRGIFSLVVTGATNNNYWMIGGMLPSQSVPIDKFR